MACGILAPWLGIDPTPPALEGRVLTTELLGKFLLHFQSHYMLRNECTKNKLLSEPLKFSTGTVFEAMWPKTFPIQLRPRGGRMWTEPASKPECCSRTSDNHTALLPPCIFILIMHMELLRVALTFFKQGGRGRSFSMLITNNNSVFSSIIGKSHWNHQSALTSLFVVTHFVSLWKWTNKRVHK